MKVNISHVFILVLIPILAGCSMLPTRTPEPASLEFKIEVHVDPNNVVDFRFGVQNAGSTEFHGDNNFVGNWELTTSEGDYQASGDLRSMGVLKPGETVFPADWEKELAPGEYTVTWGALTYDSTMVNFMVHEHDGSASVSD